MSVLININGMKMPKNCEECRFCVNGFTDAAPMYECACESYENVSVLVDDYGKPFDFRPDWCPLIELPEKHGRLIDADALHVLFENQWHYLQCLNWDENPTAEMKQTGINWCINTLHDDAPTIIEAEGDE